MPMLKLPGPGEDPDSPRPPGTVGGLVGFVLGYYLGVLGEGMNMEPRKVCWTDRDRGYIGFHAVSGGGGGLRA